MPSRRRGALAIFRVNRQNDGEDVVGECAKASEPSKAGGGRSLHACAGFAANVIRLLGRRHPSNRRITSSPLRIGARDRRREARRIFSRMKGMRSGRRARVTQAKDHGERAVKGRTGWVAPACLIPLEDNPGPLFSPSLFALNKMSFAHFVLDGGGRRLRNWAKEHSLSLLMRRTEQNLSLGPGNRGRIVQGEIFRQGRSLSENCKKFLATSFPDPMPEAIPNGGNERRNCA